MSYQTFPDFCPMREMTDTPKYALNELNLGDGYDQAAKAGINNVRYEFSRTYHLLKTNYLTVRAFLDEHGGAVPFYWLNRADGVTYLVKAPEWSATRPVSSVWAINITFSQVFS